MKATVLRVRGCLAMLIALYAVEARAQMPHPDFEDEGVFAHAWADRLEIQSRDGGNRQAWDAQTWMGGDYNKLWIKTEGSADDGTAREADVELLYDRAVTAFWDVQAGVRRDFRPGPPQNWAAIGIQGLAPYSFDVEATAYIGDAGCSAARLKVYYDLLLTQRLALEPQIEAHLYGQDDVERGVGAGLSDTRLGLRLRYELRRELAPYVGIEREQRYGDTAEAVHAIGLPAAETRWLMGLRLWY